MGGTWEGWLLASHDNVIYAVPLEAQRFRALPAMLALKIRSPTEPLPGLPVSLNSVLFLGVLHSFGVDGRSNATDRRKGSRKCQWACTRVEGE